MGYLEFLGSPYFNIIQYPDGFLQDGDYSLNASIGKTYVFLSEENSEIIGYYNLGMSSVDRIEDVGESSRYIRMGGAFGVGVDRIWLEKRIKMI